MRVLYVPLLSRELQRAYYGSNTALNHRKTVTENGKITAVIRRTGTQGNKVKVKFSHTRYRALGPELIPVYRQSARR